MNGRVTETNIVERAGDLRRPLKRQLIDPAFCMAFGFTQGMAVPVRSTDAEGVMIALDVPGLCQDDLNVAGHLQSEISSLLERAFIGRLTQESVANQTRLAVARDLHDSVLQLLAGLSFRLEALKITASCPPEIRRGIVDLQDVLRSQQQQMRKLISGLRENASPREWVDLSASIFALVGPLERQWGIRCLLRTEGAVLAPAAYEREVDFLVREAVANAVRHGKARKVEITVEKMQERIVLTLLDDGEGFAAKATGSSREPKSLKERLDALRGTLTISSGSCGSSLLICIPAST